MILTFFSARGWESWDVAHRPLIPERMPVLIDDGPAAPRPTVAVNRWLRELPVSGTPAPSSWERYARALRAWMEFLPEHGVGLFDTRARLKLALSRYAEHRAAGPLAARFAASTWGQHVSILAMFYRWALAEGHAQAEPFTYRAARALFADTAREVRVNLAVRRRPKPHVTINLPTATGRNVPLTCADTKTTCPRKESKIAMKATAGTAQTPTVSAVPGSPRTSGREATPGLWCAVSSSGQFQGPAAAVSAT